ncbi:hypothetical protein BO82DRAFT_47774 [Aspergillus uvarum CBS 121591]|uniref:Uncharacterized protein n=1 Tax=Aspergillus uvarum CBS 121591 TaxID=1448315 RepID=A0A319CEJ6_9EURO|nr:hypothetical protein BO82DRAFT_47774 [Aspergillus uvarum CBS 121591]PYH82910.1 hypothetical protein BO82DRAFT_47774 [Aspergillus uvarum CBS 121591]
MLVSQRATKKEPMEVMMAVVAATATATARVLKPNATALLVLLASGVRLQRPAAEEGRSLCRRSILTCRVGKIAHTTHTLTSRNPLCMTTLFFVLGGDYLIDLACSSRPRYGGTVLHGCTVLTICQHSRRLRRGKKKYRTP